MAQYLPLNIPNDTRGSNLLTLIEQWAAAQRTLQSGTSPPLFSSSGTVWRRTGANLQPIFMSRGDNRLDNQIPLLMPDVSAGVTAAAVSRDLSSYVIARDNTTLEGKATGGLIVPHGTEAQRTDHDFRLRGNTESDELEVRIDGEERIVYSGSLTLADRISTDMDRRLVAGANVTITRSSMTNSLTISATGGSGGGGAGTISGGDGIAATTVGSVTTISAAGLDAGNMSIGGTRGDGRVIAAGTGTDDLVWRDAPAVSGSLTDLDDVSGTAMDQYVLTYASATDSWSPQPPAGGGGSAITVSGGEGINATTSGSVTTLDAAWASADEARLADTGLKVMNPERVETFHDHQWDSIPLTGYTRAASAGAVSAGQYHVSGETLTIQPKNALDTGALTRATAKMNLQVTTSAGIGLVGRISSIAVSGGVYTISLTTPYNGSNTFTGAASVLIEGNAEWRRRTGEVSSIASGAVGSATFDATVRPWVQGVVAGSGTIVAGENIQITRAVGSLTISATAGTGSGGDTISAGTGISVTRSGGTATVALRPATANTYDSSGNQTGTGTLGGIIPQGFNFNVAADGRLRIQSEGVGFYDLHVEGGDGIDWAYKYEYSSYGKFDKGVISVNKAHIQGIARETASTTFFAGDGVTLSSTNTSVTISATGIDAGNMTIGGSRASGTVIAAGSGTNDLVWATAGGGSGWTTGATRSVTSGTTAEWTGLPAGLEEIRISFSGVSLSSTGGLFRLQIGGASYSDFGYTNAGSYMRSSAGRRSAITSTNGFYPAYNWAQNPAATNQLATQEINGVVKLIKGAGTWFMGGDPVEHHKRKRDGPLRDEIHLRRPAEGPHRRHFGVVRQGPARNILSMTPSDKYSRRGVPQWQ